MRHGRGDRDRKNPKDQFNSNIENPYSSKVPRR